MHDDTRSALMERWLHEFSYEVARVKDSLAVLHILEYLVSHLMLTLAKDDPKDLYTDFSRHVTAQIEKHRESFNTAVTEFESLPHKEGAASASEQPQPGKDDLLPPFPHSDAAGGG